jgi:hypothetical protein
LSTVTDARQPQRRPISALPMLAAHAELGVAMAREYLDLLGQARGASLLSDADVTDVTASWTHPHRPGRTSCHAVLLLEGQPP